MQLRDLDDSKHSNSFELVAIDDHYGAGSSSRSPPSPLPPQLSPITHNKKSSFWSAFSLTPRGRLFALASYLLVNSHSPHSAPLLQSTMTRQHIRSRLFAPLTYLSFIVPPIFCSVRLLRSLEVPVSISVWSLLVHNPSNSVILSPVVCFTQVRAGPLLVNKPWICL